MRDIKINLIKEDDMIYIFKVSVKEGDGESVHTVTLQKDYYKSLVFGNESPEDLLIRSFDFLLSREPKEAILETFDLSVIQRYFPEYENIVKKPVS